MSFFIPVSASFTQLEYPILPVPFSSTFRRETFQRDFLCRPNSFKIGTSFPTDPVQCESQCETPTFLFPYRIVLHSSTTRIKNRCKGIYRRTDKRGIANRWRWSVASGHRSRLLQGGGTVRRQGWRRYGGESALGVHEQTLYAIGWKAHRWRGCCRVKERPGERENERCARKERGHGRGRQVHTQSRHIGQCRDTPVHCLARLTYWPTCLLLLRTLTSSSPRFPVSRGSRRRDTGVIQGVVDIFLQTYRRTIDYAYVRRVSIGILNKKK